VTIRAADEDPGSMLLQVKVSIVGSDPAIWRLLEIDPSLTLDRVHEVLQTAVGWRDSHLHSFTDTDPYVRLRAVNGIVREPRRWVSQDLLEDSDDDLPETAGPWARSSPRNPVPCSMNMTSETAGSTASNSPEASPSGQRPKGAAPGRGRRAPLEDSGGIGGYHDLLDALADPGHEDHKDLKAWVTWTAGPWQEFDPEQLDINAVNNELALLFPAPKRTRPRKRVTDPGTHEPDASRPATRIPFIPARRRTSTAPQRSKQTSPRR
jgi:hypothetical protein